MSTNTMSKYLRSIRFSSLFAVSFLLAACGGGGDRPDTACQALTSDGTGVVVGSNLPGDPSLPEPASGYRAGLKVVYAQRYMVGPAIHLQPA